MRDVNAAFSETSVLIEWRLITDILFQRALNREAVIAVQTGAVNIHIC